MSCIAFFDFDGTITSNDSLADFIQFAVGKPAYYIGILKVSPILAGYACKLYSNHFAKEELITHFFKNWHADKFQELATQYSLYQIDRNTRPKAIEKIKWHQEKNHEIVIVSASIGCWLKAWCEKNNVNLIATRLEIKDGKLTGKFANRNCYGIEKANRVRETYDLSQYDHIYAYGDSRGDKELLALADESFYKPFRK